MSFNGSEFVAIDTRAVENTANAARPADEFIEYAQLNNLLYLDEFGHQVGFSPYSGNAGDYSSYTGERPFCSIAPSTRFFFPWVYQPGLDEIGVYGVGRAANEGGSSAGVTINLTAYTLDGDTLKSRAQQTAGLESESATPPFQPYEVELTGLNVQTTEIAPLALWVRSQSGDTYTASASNVSYYDLTVESVGAGFYSDSSGAKPSSTGMDTQYTLGERVPVDHLGDHPDADRVNVTPAPSVLGDISRHYLGYLQCRGFQIEQRFKPQTPQYAQHRANVPVLGESVQSLAIRRDNTYRRMRPVWVGPRGQAPAVETGWPSGYAERFVHAYADGSTYTMFEADFKLSTTDPDLMILAYLAPVYLVADVDIGPALNLGLEKPPLVPWTLDVELLQLAEGDADYNDATVLGSNSASPLELSLEHRAWVGAGNDPLGYACLARYEGAYPYKEGQLFAADLSRLTLTSCVISTTHDERTMAPVRLRLDANVADPNNDINWYDNLAQENELIDLVLVGASIWEVPR